MAINGYVNPRDLGNDEPCKFLGMDIFIEEALWVDWIQGRTVGGTTVATWDVVFML